MKVVICLMAFLAGFLGGHLIDANNLRGSIKPIRLVVNMRSSFTQKKTDSVWWADEFGLDTAIGLKNWKPYVVVIFDDKDTVRHMGGDTIKIYRYSHPKQTQNVISINQSGGVIAGSVNISSGDQIINNK